MRALFICAALVLALISAVYFLMNQGDPLREQPDAVVTEEAQSEHSTVPHSTAPSVVVIEVESEGPASISISYENLPSHTSALALCLVGGGGCTEWVEAFTPSTPTGTYTMSVQKAFLPESKKGIAAGSYQIVVVGTGFGDHIVSSPVFVVK